MPQMRNCLVATVVLPREKHRHGGDLQFKRSLYEALTDQALPCARSIASSTYLTVKIRKS